MNILENYNNAKQKYGEEIAEIIRSAGIPDEYIYIACKYYNENSVPIKTLKLEIRQWMSYIRNLGNETFDLSKLDYRSFKSILTKAIQKAMKPNPIYDNGVVFVGEFKTKEDALLYPIPNNWCTSNSSLKFNKYTQGGYRLFIIENKTLDEPLKYVCASVFMGNVKYWNTEGFSLFEELRSEYNINDSEHQKYQATLPKEVISYLYDIAASQTEEKENQIRTENKEYKMNNNMAKKLIRLTECDLHRIIKESVKNVLKETKNPFDKLSSMKNYVDGQNNYQVTDIHIQQTDRGIYVDTSCTNEYGGRYGNNDEEFIPWENVQNWLMKIIRKGGERQKFSQQD